MTHVPAISELYAHQMLAGTACADRHNGLFLCCYFIAALTNVSSVKQAHSFSVNSGFISDSMALQIEANALIDSLCARFNTTRLSDALLKKMKNRWIVVDKENQVLYNPFKLARSSLKFDPDLDFRQVLEWELGKELKGGYVHKIAVDGGIWAKGKIENMVFSAFFHPLQSHAAVVQPGVGDAWVPEAQNWAEPGGWAFDWASTNASSGNKAVYQVGGAGGASTGGGCYVDGPEENRTDKFLEVFDGTDIEGLFDNIGKLLGKTRLVKKFDRTFEQGGVFVNGMVDDVIVTAYWHGSKCHASTLQAGSGGEIWPATKVWVAPGKWSFAYRTTNASKGNVGFFELEDTLEERDRMVVSVHEAQDLDEVVKQIEKMTNLSLGERTGKSAVVDGGLWVSGMAGHIVFSAFYHKTKMHAVSVQPAGLPVHPPKKVWVNPGEWALAFSPTQSKDGNFGFYHLKDAEDADIFVDTDVPIGDSGNITKPEEIKATIDDVASFIEKLREVKFTSKSGKKVIVDGGVWITGKLDNVIFSAYWHPTKVHTCTVQTGKDAILLPSVKQWVLPGKWALVASEMRSSGNYAFYEILNETDWVTIPGANVAINLHDMSIAECGVLEDQACKNMTSKDLQYSREDVDGGVHIKGKHKGRVFSAFYHPTKEHCAYIIPGKDAQMIPPVKDWKPAGKWAVAVASSSSKTGNRAIYEIRN